MKLVLPFSLYVVLTLLIYPAFAFEPKVVQTEVKDWQSIVAFDDTTTLLRIDEGVLFISKDNGNKWDKISHIKEKVLAVDIDSNFNNDRAFVRVSNNFEFYVTNDRGQNWRKISHKLLDSNNKNDDAACSITTTPFNKDFIHVSCLVCEQEGKGKKISDYKKSDLTELGNSNRDPCKTLLYISNNEGRNFNEIVIPNERDNIDDNKILSTYTECKFAKFTKDSDLDIPVTTLFCNKMVNKMGKHKSDLTITESTFFYTDDFGRNVKLFEQFKDMTVAYVKLLKSYVVVLTQDDKFNALSPKKIWISKDGKSFQQAYFPSQIRYDITGIITQDDANRIILPIVRSKDENENENANENEKDQDKKLSERKVHIHTPRRETISETFISDSTGLKFSVLDWTVIDGRSSTLYHLVDWLKGTSIVRKLTSIRHGGHNTKTRTSHKINTKITTDNGNTWQNLKIVDPGNEKAYSCDINDPENCFLTSFYFSKIDHAPTAGILLMVGTVSDGSAIDIDNLSTFISRDGGLTWEMVFEFPTAFATGDYGNIIVAVPFDPSSDDDPTSEIYYSLDHGQSWGEYELKESFIPIDIFTVTNDGSGSNFMLSGMKVDNNSNQMFNNNVVYSIDFSDAFNGEKCKESDYEIWNLNNGNPINGAKYSYKRRKLDAKCLVRETFTDLVWKEEPIDDCTENDYECAFEFVKDANGKCVPDLNLMKLANTCKNNKKVQLKSMNLITNNKCKNKLDIQPTEVNCEHVPESGRAGNDITVTENTFSGKVSFYEYFDSAEYETVIIGDRSGSVYLSHDGGQNLHKIDTKGEPIKEIVFNSEFPNAAYLFGAKGSLFVTQDRGQTFVVSQLPESMQLGFPLDFNAKDINSFIYYGGKDCKSILDPNCRAVAYITKDNGASFQELLSNTIHCEFSGSQYDHPYDPNMIICQVRDTTTNKKMLLSSTDYFKNDKKVLYDNIVGYMSTGGISVVAVNHASNDIRAYVTQDGFEFAEARLPQYMQDKKQQSFTVLGVQMGSIFLHLSTEDQMRGNFGSLLKSNSNGTSFVTLRDEVNRNKNGIVDFEKLQGLEGIILINTVENSKEVVERNEAKQVRTQITYNDGSDWSYLPGPAKDSTGKKYNCNIRNKDKCSLNLHGFSEVTDIRDTYSSGSAFGMLFAVGNVGDSLLPFKDCSTFFSSDGGSTWQEVTKEPTHWEFGDHGGVLVVVSTIKATNKLKYSLDSGKTWKEFQFSEKEVHVRDIITVPQDSALRFLLIADDIDVSGQSGKTFTIDFYNSFKRQCDFDMENGMGPDFKFTPINPILDQCLFGRRTEYLTKIHNDCYVGNIPLSKYERVVENCTCTRNDFECDYNYVRAKDGTCKLVEGLSPQPASDVCKLDSSLIEYSEPTGYRKIPVSSCQGGLKLDSTSDKYPCPGKEREFREKYSVSGGSFFGWFFFLFFTFVIVGVVVYDRGIRRNGGFARFGEIRLGEEGELVENNKFDKVINEIVKGGVILVGGIISISQLSTRGIGNVFAKIRGRFSKRRGPSYSSLMHDQFIDEADDLLAGHDDDADDLASFMDHESNFDIEDDDNSSMVGQVPFNDELANESNMEDPAHVENLIDEEDLGVVPGNDTEGTNTTTAADNTKTRTLDNDTK